MSENAEQMCVRRRVVQSRLPRCTVVWSRVQVWAFAFARYLDPFHSPTNITATVNTQQHSITHHKYSTSSLSSSQHTSHHNSLSDADDLRLPRDIDVINARGPPAFACPSTAAGGSRVAGSVLIGRKASSLGVPSGSLGRGDMRLGNAPIDCVCFGFGRESTDSPWYLNPPCSNDLRRSS